MIIKLREYGSILTGRPFGKKVMEQLSPTLKHPVVLDFDGTITMGSSFGDEIVPAIANKQDGKIEVINASKVIWSCLDQLAEDHNIQVLSATER